MKKRASVFVSLFMVLFLIQILQAQPGSPPPEGPEKQGEMKAKIEILRTWKLIKELKLTEEQAVKFFPLLTKSDTRREGLETQKRQAIRELHDLLEDKKPSSKKIQRLVARLRKTAQEFQGAKQDFLDQAAAVLSAEQQARLILFEQRFRHQLKEVIREMRHKRLPLRGPEFPEPGPPADLEMRLRKQMERQRDLQVRLKKQIERMQTEIRRAQRQIDSLQKKRGE